GAAGRSGDHSDRAGHRLPDRGGSVGKFTRPANALGENAAIERLRTCDVVIGNDACRLLETGTGLRFARRQVYSPAIRQLDVTPDDRPAGFDNVFGIFRKTLWKSRHNNTSLDIRSPNTARRSRVQTMSKARLSSICTAKGISP